MPRTQKLREKEKGFEGCKVHDMSVRFDARTHKVRTQPRYPFELRSRCGSTHCVRTKEWIGGSTSQRASGEHHARCRGVTLTVTTLHRHGLPTRSRVVSEFMIGLEKTKARSNEASQSARALTLHDMHRLYDLCHRPGLSLAEQRWGIIRWVSVCQIVAVALDTDRAAECVPARIPDDAPSRRGYQPHVRELQLRPR